jgi:hypothetical protein
MDRWALHISAKVSDEMMKQKKSVLTAIQVVKGASLVTIVPVEWARTMAFVLF